MSWSAPSAGSAPPYQAAPPYAQQPYAQHPPYGQPPYPHTLYQQSAPPQSQPASAPTTYPPKRKGNPVITRYPPPPGYRPPQPPSAQLPYGPGQYPPQGYQQPPQNYPPQSYQQGYQGYQQPPQGYQPGWQPPPGYPPPQGYQQQGYQQPPPPPPDASSAQPAYPPNGWQQSPTFPPSSHSGSLPPPPPDSAISPTTTVPPGTGHSSPSHSSRPSKSRRNTRTASIDTQAVPEAQRLYQSEAYTINLGLDEWDQTDFDGAIWPKANEPVEPDFSLGVITWHPANEITLALPSDFNKAEEVAAEPAPPKIGNGDAVSKYFAPDNAHEAFLDVRQTDEWDSVKHDSIFYEFPKASDIVALEDVLANRDRPDPEGENPYPSIEENRGRDGREDSDWNVMDNLEQALSSEQPAGDSTESGNNRSTPTPVSRDDAQEALLASLGVTGSPKPVKPLPSPAHLPPHPQKGSKRGSTDNDRPYEEYMHSRHLPPTHQNGSGPRGRHSSQGAPTSSLHSPSLPPPPLQRQQSPSHDSWRVDQAPVRNGDRRQSPARSENSQHTATGSDFHMEDNDPFNPNAAEPQKPRLHRADSSAGRKRSYEEAESPQRQEDDYAKRFKRKQPRVAAAYGSKVETGLLRHTKSRAASTQIAVRQPERRNPFSLPGQMAKAAF